MPQRSSSDPNAPNSLFESEEEVLQFWQSKQIFAKSLRKNANAEPFSFYDGPPFITGTPHYATLLPSIAKDIIPRYQTMKGKLVRRIWGWDVHGLPAETQVEKNLGLKVKADIEKLGVAKFIEECRRYVRSVSEEWRWYIDHIGRWAELDKAYRTDQLSYMETVMWVFKQLYNKGLIYRGKRTSLFCPRCGTPLSKFEVTMDDDTYREVEDPAVTVAFRVLNDEVYLLAWTTTPWTLPANLALAIDPDAEYVKVTDGRHHYILSHQALERYRDKDLAIVESFKGKKLIGERYEPLYEFLSADPERDHRIYAAGFVSHDEGTGIVHVAPGFGEDDTKLGEALGLSLHETIDDEGRFVEAVKPWAGQFYKEADPLIVEELKRRHLLFKEGRLIHSYPHCYRCGTPLIYKAQVSWFLSLSPLRKRLLRNNGSINWIPKHFGDKRFVYNLENAPDWSLSRSRYWGTTIPVWESKDGEIYVAGSLSELEKLSGQKITDLHRPAIDEIVLNLPSGKKAYRVKEVLDCWFESGAMPFAQDHYPFENESAFKKHFPADFIVEYTGQLRGWFYYLHVLSNALKAQNAFRNVVVTGVLMGTDGRKMSKSYGNYPDPRGTIERYGAESLRLYLMGSKIMNGEDVEISETEIRESSRLLGIFHNSLRYYQTYAKAHRFNPDKASTTGNLLDRWIGARLEEFISQYAGSLDQFDFVSSTKAIRPFVEDLSTWYIRRSRQRFVEGDTAALATLHRVLQRFAQAVAPTLPFSAETLYQALGAGPSESVHLTDYPALDKHLLAPELTQAMSSLRAIASQAHMIRAKENISLRQPLQQAVIYGYPELASNAELVEILRDELNVIEIVFEPDTQKADRAESLRLELNLTDALKAEGRFRELIRLLQEARKKAGLEVGQLATLHYWTRDDELRKILEDRAAEIAKQVSLRSIEPAADSTELTRIPDEELAVAFD